MAPLAETSSAIGPHAIPVRHRSRPERGGTVSGGAYDGRGNKDRSLGDPRGMGTQVPSMRGGISVPEEAGMPFLIGERMTGGYGTGPDILHDCTIAVESGEIAVIVGPNGAGKSTGMKAVFGMLSLRAGRVVLDGEDITRLSPQDRVAKGMGFVPQTANIFTSMTVEENLEMGAFIRKDDISGTMEQVYDLFPILREKRRQPAGELSGGQRQQVAVGRALMTRPKVLMLDEPTAGVSPIVMDELFDRIIEVARTGIPILMVEQNARQALDIADKGHVLVQGRNAYTGTGKELLADPEVRRSFLGG
jgi:branched-chain amino acid transport system ATP-binding protein